MLDRQRGSGGNISTVELIQCNVFKSCPKCLLPHSGVECEMRVVLYYLVGLLYILIKWKRVHNRFMETAPCVATDQVLHYKTVFTYGNELLLFFLFIRS